MFLKMYYWIKRYLDVLKVYYWIKCYSDVFKGVLLDLTLLVALHVFNSLLY